MPDRNESEAMCDQTHRPFSLSPRQTQVLVLAAQGLTLVGIGNRLFLTERTIRKHLGDARNKLNAINTTHAVAIAITNQLIEIKPDDLVSPQKATYMW